VTRGRRGVALADFLAGSLILAGAVTGFSTMTRTKLVALSTADQHARALAAAEEAIDRVRTGGLPRAPQGDADPDGFRLVLVFNVKDLPEGMGRVEVRSLRLDDDGPGHGLYEARAVVRWQDGPERRARVALSTVAPLTEAGPR
jgi:hypothetical protein